MPPQENQIVLAYMYTSLICAKPQITGLLAMFIPVQFIQLTSHIQTHVK